MEAEVADLQSQKASLEAQLDEDAATNAEQIIKITALTVRAHRRVKGSTDGVTGV